MSLRGVKGNFFVFVAMRICMTLKLIFNEFVLIRRRRKKVNIWRNLFDFDGTEMIWSSHESKKPAN